MGYRYGTIPIPYHPLQVDIHRWGIFGQQGQLARWVFGPSGLKPQFKRATKTRKNDISILFIFVLLIK